MATIPYPSPTRIYREGGVEFAEHFKFKSDVMKRLIADIADVVPTMLPLLFFGEPGVGKNFLAQAVKNASPRKAGPFVQLNAVETDPTLLRSEWFGHKKGSFTGAINDHDGKFVSAKGGVLFLDELLELPVWEQARILRAVEYRQVTPVGANEPITVDARFFFASNRTREQVLSRRDLWRLDFVSRLGVAWFTVPPLRERLEDLPDLTDAIVKEASSTFGRDVQPEVPARTRAALAARPWWGNLRELRSVLQVGVARCKGGVLLPENLPPGLEVRTERASIQTVDDMIREHIRRAVAACGGNKKEAAALLGVGRDFIYDRFGGDDAAPEADDADQTSPHA